MENHSNHNVETGYPPGYLLIVPPLRHVGSSRYLHFRATGHDEMCNFYVMYWMNATDANRDEGGGCGGDGDYQWGQGELKNVPDDASSLP